MGETVQDELTRKIIGCAYTVHNKLGAGFLESIYEKAMAVELARAGLDAVCQANVAVYYDGQVLGEFRADLVVEDTVIVELKAIEKITAVHEVQLVNYLTATGKPIGLLLNFGPHGVTIKRKVRTLHPKSGSCKS